MNPCSCCGLAVESPVGAALLDLSDVAARLELCRCSLGWCLACANCLTHCKCKPPQPSWRRGERAAAPTGSAQKESR